MKKFWRVIEKQYGNFVVGNRKAYEFKTKAEAEDFAKTLKHSEITFVEKFK